MTVSFFIPLKPFKNSGTLRVCPYLNCDLYSPTEVKIFNQNNLKAALFKVNCI